MIAFGHAPAWLHVAGCEHGNHLVEASTYRPQDDACCCHHGHDHQASEAEEGEPNPASRGHQHPHGHDSDTCAICQSLVAPTGVKLDLDPVVHDEGLVAVAAIAELSAPAPTLRSIPQPRGPPALNA